MPRTRLVACLLLTTALVGTASEVRAVSGLDETTALAAFLAESPQVAAARRAVEVAKADVLAAQVWANPTLDASREQIFSSGGPTQEHRLGVALPVSLPGKRALRGAIAEAGVEASEARSRARIQTLATEFRQTFGRTYHAEGRAAALKEGLTAFTRLETVVMARQRAGESAGYDVLRLRLQTTALQARLIEIETEGVRERGRLVALRGRPLEGPLLLSLPDDLPEEDRLVAEALLRRADLLTLRAERRQAQSGLELAARQQWPDPSVSLGLRQTSEPTVQGLGYAAGASWPMPLFDRNQAARARAEAEALRLAAEEQALTARVRAEVAAGRRALVARQAALTRYRKEVLPTAPQVVKVAEVAYREGEQGIVALIDAHEAALQARLLLFDLSASAHDALLDLETLVGSTLPEMRGDLR